MIARLSLGGDFGRTSGRLLPCAFLCVLFGIGASPCLAHADAVSDFYSHKALTLIAGFPPGGGYDAYVRVLARHYGHFIPGNPSVVPENMPGAGS
jgi:tripartite-type tricarboxylate transporter receptor subunit TctC